MNAGLKMTPAERQQRRCEKQAVLLEFLASGEVWTVLPVAAELLQTSQRNALRLLQSMVQAQMLKVDGGVCKFTRQKLYGITDHGLMLASLESPCKAFALGRTNPMFIQHHVQSQLARIQAERAGWSGWTPGKALYIDNSKRLKKLPDSIATRPDGRRAAIEIERFVKSPKRLQDIVATHLQQILAGHYQVVYYLTPHPQSQQKAFDKIASILIDGQKVQLTDNHRSRFKVINTNNWKGEM